MKAIIDDGIIAKRQDVVVALALVIAGPGGRSTGRSRLAQRWSLLPDRRGPHLRPAHRGLRPRPAHAAGLLHPHPDRRAGHPAQQRRHRRPAGLHRHPVRRWWPTWSSLVLVARRDARACPGRSRSSSLRAVSRLPLPGAAGRPQAAGLTRERCSSTPSMSTMMTERFNVAGRHARQAVRPPRRGDRRFADRAGRVRDIGVTDRACTAGSSSSRSTWCGARHRPRLRRGRRAGRLRHVSELGTLVALAALLMRLYGPLTRLSNVQVDVMTALVRFERVFEVLDLRPMIAETPAPGRVPDRPGLRRVRRRPVPLPVAPPRCRWPRWRRSPSPTPAPATRCCTVSASRPPGRDGRPGRPVGRGQDHHHAPGRRGSTTRRGRGPRQRRGRARRHPGLPARHASASSRRTPTCSTTPSRANLRYARPEATDEELGRPARRADLPTWSRRCPRAWTPWWATAAIGSPAARSSGSPSPGCC